MPIPTFTRLAVLTLAMAAAGPAAAAPVVYNNRAAFLTALGAVPAVQTYEAIDPSLWGTEVSTLGLATSTFALGGVTVESPGGINADRDFALSNTQLSTSFSGAPAVAARRLTVTLANGVNGIGLDLLDYQSPDTAGSDPLTITVFGVATTVNGSPAAGAPDFFGVIDAGATTSTLTISRTAEVFYPLTFDNVTYGNALAATVPEPASVGLFGIAALLIARMRRRG